MQHNIVNFSNTHDRIGDELESRVRVHRDGVEREEFRLTTGSSLLHRNSVHIIGRFTIDSDRSVGDVILMEAFHHDTVAVPSVNFATSNTTVHNVSANREGSALTNRGSIQINELSVNLRNVVHSNTEGIVRDTEVFRKRVNRKVFHEHDIIGGSRRSEGLDLMGSTRNQMSFIGLIFEPLEGKHRLVIIIQVSLQRNVTAFADSISIASDVHNGLVIDIHIERIRSSRTTITVGNSNREDQRIVVCRGPHLIVVVISTEGVGSELTALVPSVGSIEVSITVNPSLQLNVRIELTIVTHIRVTVDGDNRVLLHEDRVRRSRNSLATRHVINDVGLIDIVNRIAIIDVGLSTELRSVDGLEFHTIQFPHVVVFSIDNKIAVLIAHVSSNV